MPDRSSRSPPAPTAAGIATMDGNQRVVVSDGWGAEPVALARHGQFAGAVGVDRDGVHASTGDGLERWGFDGVSQMRESVPNADPALALDHHHGAPLALSRNKRVFIAKDAERYLVRVDSRHARATTDRRARDLRVRGGGGCRPFARGDGRQDGGPRFRRARDLLARGRRALPRSAPAATAAGWPSRDSRHGSLERRYRPDREHASGESRRNGAVARRRPARRADGGKSRSGIARPARASRKSGSMPRSGPCPSVATVAPSWPAATRPWRCGRWPRGRP